MIGYICNSHGYQREICHDLGMKLTQPLGGIQQAGAPKTAEKQVTPIVFTCGHSDYERSDTNLYSTKRVVPKLVVREGFQGGTRDPSVFLHKKNTFCFHLSASVNKFLRFCVLPLLVSKNGHCNFSQPFC